MVAGWRGIDEILGGLREIYNNEPNARSFTHMAVDLVTGDKSLTNKIVLATDFVIGGLSARQAAQNAAIKAEAKQAAIAARAGTVTDDVAAATRQAVHSYSGGTTRALEPVVAPISGAGRKLFNSLDDFKARSGFVSRSDKEAAKAFEVYQNAGKAQKGIVIGHDLDPINQGHKGWQAFRMKADDWTYEINMS